MYDVIIIGAGVVGCCIARELAKTERNVLVLEASLDVCEGTSKANSGIVHAGFDAMPGTLKAKLNVRGNQMMDELAEKLDIPFRRNGSLVLCLEETGKDKLQELYQRGIENGVTGLQILTADEVRKQEPQISTQVVAALYAPAGGIVCPFELTIAMAENAAENGVVFKRNQQVTAIEEKEQGYRILTKDGNAYDAQMVVNAAGIYADVIHNMLPPKEGHEPMQLIARRGEYCLYDKKAGVLTDKTIFQLPGAYGKGILVTPTIHGNQLLGPTAMDIEDKEGVNTTADGLSQILEKAANSVQSLPSKGQIITSFAGLRAHHESDDFVIEESKAYQGFIDVAGIESPGLTSAPAIGEYVAELIMKLAPAKLRQNFIETRRGIRSLEQASMEERQQLIKENPAYANIICRCETVSEGEILDAIHRPVGAVTLDGVKRRTRASMGRCQGGFCSPKIMKLLSEELNIPMEEVCKSGAGSASIIGDTK
ncbi:MAG: NAD(P)/FAD-dependent oxidoreductase [Lachnospiraceae bacterium]|nr:NAD(P)/FAD-dependent oxidoreductase [Lachnospiraceae bacterium]